MRSRAIIHVTGQRGAGKTAFVEAVIRGIGGPVLVARCVRDDTLRDTRETRPRSHRELRRYRAAGASEVANFAFPGSDVGSDAFYMTRLMEEYSDAVIMEGDNPLGVADLTVCIASPPSRGERLLVRRAARSSERARADEMRRLLGEPGGVERLLHEIVGPSLAGIGLQHPELLEGMRVKMTAEIESARHALPRNAPKQWAVAPDYRGIEHAQLVVVNVRAEAERARAERLVADVGRLRSDGAVFADVLHPRGTRIPVTAVVANVEDPRDRGLRKALARVMRTTRAVIAG